MIVRVVARNFLAPAAVSKSICSPRIFSGATVRQLLAFARTRHNL